MTQAQLEREVSEATGESLATVRSRGFQLLEFPEQEPQYIDWDALDARRMVLFPPRPARPLAA